MGIQYRESTFVGGFGISDWTAADEEFITLPWKATLYSYSTPNSNVFGYDDGQGRLSGMCGSGSTIN